MLLLFSGRSAPFPAIIKHYSEHETIRIHSVYLLNKATLVRREEQNSFSLLACIRITFTTKLKKKKKEKRISKKKKKNHKTTKTKNQYYQVEN